MHQFLPHLKEMELSYMEALVMTPDIGGLPCLQKLILKGCESLEEMHPSLGYHSNLVHVSIRSCDKLTRFPTIVQMEKLEILDISNCVALTEFPKIEAKMDGLIKLSLRDVGIEILPSTIVEYCTNLTSLSLKGCSKLKSIEGNFHALKGLENFELRGCKRLEKLPKGVFNKNLDGLGLRKLELRWCGLKDGEIPKEVGELSSLQELHLSGNDFTQLDFSLSRLTQLKLLDLSDCENLVELPELPSSLAILKVYECKSLEVIEDDAHRRCKSLCEVSISRERKNIEGKRKNITGGERLLESMLQGKAVQSGCMILQLSGLEIPRGFEPRVVRGRTCRMQVPENWFNDFSGFLFCVVLNNDYDFQKMTICMKHDDYSMRMQDSEDDMDWEETSNDENTCMIYVSFGLLRNTSWWDQTSTPIHLEIDSLDKYTVSGCGSRLIPKTTETTITDSSFDDVSDDYTCRLKILHDSMSAFKFCVDYLPPPNLNIPRASSSLSSLDLVVEDDKLVGMGTRLQQVRSHLRIGSGGVRMVGIWGVGGGGKTTLANSLYMEFSADFDGCCFLDNIREESKRHGLKRLQEKILSTVFDKQMQVESVDLGKHKIKRMLCRRNVLIVLDDVDHLKQLEALAGCHNWFGNGSRIIITTGNEQVLKSHTVDEVCPVSLLSHDEAIRLFKRHAYQAPITVEDYEKLSLSVISYLNGLPLAIKILGAFLYGKDKDEWISTLDRLKDHPEMGIVVKLKISYDGLTDVEKELFVDIACFFRGRSKDEAMKILDACGFYPVIGVKVLIQKALITVSEDGKFDMHDLVQEMAHYIVRGEHPKNPENHSRVWRKEDIEDICSRNATMENNEIEAIQCYPFVRSPNFIMLVSNMKKLRFLKVTTTSFDEGPSFLSNELRYIDWEGYPTSPFLESFQPRKLVVLKMKRSLQKELWNGYKCLPCLKEMELSYMKALVRTPDFGGLQCLQKLILKGCGSLEEIHDSLGNHNSLVHVSVSICDKLTRFPTIVKMDKLKILRISECKALIEFPKIEANMDNLVELSLYEVGIQVLPPSIGEYCTNLISLKLEWCSKLVSIQGNLHALEGLKNFHVNSYNLGSIEGNLPRSSLTTLDLSWCKLKDGEIPTEIGELSNLRELHLKCNDFSRLDFSLSRLTNLKLLDLRRCENLVELPELPSNLAILNADGCGSLEVIKDDAHRRCEWLCDVSIQGDRQNISGGERLLESMLQGKAVKNGCMILQLKGLEIPRGFEPRVEQGRRCTMQVPGNWYNHFSGFLFCVVLDNYGDYFDIPKITTRMKHEKLTDDYSDLPKITTRMKHEKLTGDSMRDSQDGMYWEENDKNTCMIYVSFGLLRNTSWWDQTSNAIQVEIDSLDDGYRVIGCGCKLIPNTSETTDRDSPFDDVSEDYACGLKIRHDIFYVSESAFKFYIEYSFRPNLNVYLTKTQI